MTFSEFAMKIGNVLKGKTKQAVFVETLFEHIIPEDQFCLIEDLSDSTWKGYYQGNPINEIARTIVGVADPMCFKSFIDDQDDLPVEKLCAEFLEDLPDIYPMNAGEMLGNLFDQIIREAAADSNKKNYVKYTESEKTFSSSGYVVKQEDGSYVTLSSLKVSPHDPFRIYIDKAVSEYSMKKTLLYLEKKRPFYSMYVCNDLRLKRSMSGSGFRNNRNDGDVTIPMLAKYSKCNIIQGTGGIGKTMFMTHLFLSSAEEYKSGGKLPVLCLLKDYKKTYPDLLTFVLDTVNEYAPEVIREDLIEKLEQNQLILLLDGLDEIKSQLKESFDDNLSTFVKRYSDCIVVLTSRPISDFVSYSAFNVYDIQPLRKEQSIALIRKLEFWDEKAKMNFIADLDKRLYSSHQEFASNPLLLTIMLMTYTNYGDIPAKMHAFYAKAYDTMARAHDKTKDSFQRVLYTKLDPERFADYFAAFCARTFVKEQIEFTRDEFAQYMKKAIAEIPREEDDEGATLTASAFLRDLTDNMCIMYREGERYHFIHRSFQEYFAAVYFMKDEDLLLKVGEHFEENGGLFCRRVLDMMFEMNADRVERKIFHPYLRKLFVGCGATTKQGRYWGFLREVYPIFYYNEGDFDDPDVTKPHSFLYNVILDHKKLSEYDNLDDFYDWPDDISDFIKTQWVEVYTDYYSEENINEARVLDEIEEYGADMIAVRKERVSDEYTRVFGEPIEVGTTYEFVVEDILDDELRYLQLINIVQDKSFPLFVEYKKVVQYYSKLEERVKKRSKSGLFND